MKKSLCLLTFGLMLTLLSCNHQDLPENNPDITPDRKDLHLVEIKNESFFSTSNLRFDFAEIDEDIYLNYMPDGLNTTKWILLSENEAGISATIVWSEDIREIGKTENNIKIYLNGSVPYFESEFFGVQKLALNEGVEASRFDPEKVPPLKSEYLSNFSGKYNLENHKYELTIGAKLGLSESVNSYWNANVLNTVYDEDTKTYDLILAHSSQNNSSGSISPGITGNEPFITKQGLFWSHMTLTAEPGSIWKIKWSSVWFNSPYEALNATMDCSDTFIGPETTKITYRYNFYFGTPKLKESGYGVEAEGEELLGTYTEESAVAKNITWADVKNLIPSYQLPENKLADYWWYNTDSLSPIIESSVFKVSDTTDLGLYEYDFYLALKDKPEVGNIFTRDGTYSRGAYTVVIEGLKLTYNDVTYDIKDIKIGSSFDEDKGGLPNIVYYLMSNNSVNYYCKVEYSINNTQQSNRWINFSEPKQTEDIKMTEGTPSVGTRRGTLNIQE